MSEKLEKCLRDSVASVGFELWGYEFQPQQGQSQLNVYIEKPGGVSIDDCTRASRQIGAVLDVEDAISGAYRLDVSSPGVYRTLFKPEQYSNYIGHDIKLRLRRPHEGQRRFKGGLVSCNEKLVTIQLENDQVAFSFDDIEKAQLA